MHERDRTKRMAQRLYAVIVRIVSRPLYREDNLTHHPQQFKRKSSQDLYLHGLVSLLKALAVVLMQFRTAIVMMKFSRGSVYKPPGTFVLKVLSFVFSKKAFETVFAQAILDMREEHAEALASKQIWKSKWIVLRDHINICITVAFYIATSMGKKVIGIWKLLA